VEVAISFMSRVEIFVGSDNKIIEKTKSLLDQYSLLGIYKEIAKSITGLRKRYGWELPDAFQAALCIHRHIKLSIQNIKCFDPIKIFFVEIPYEI
jgi:predicted nucleic acid-binding protein